MAECAAAVSRLCALVGDLVAPICSYWARTWISHVCGLCASRAEYAPRSKAESCMHAIVLSE
eukprot:15432716-Alexandrium_andersonii.AAC.1